MDRKELVAFLTNAYAHQLEIGNKIYRVDGPGSGKHGGNVHYYVGDPEEFDNIGIELNFKQIFNNKRAVVALTKATWDEYMGGVKKAYESPKRVAKSKNK